MCALGKSRAFTSREVRSVVKSWYDTMACTRYMSQPGKNKRRSFFNALYGCAPFSQYSRHAYSDSSDKFKGLDQVFYLLLPSAYQVWRALECSLSRATRTLFCFTSGDLAETLSEDRRRVLEERLERDEKVAQQETAAPSTASGERRRSVPRSMSACHIKNTCRVRCVAREGRAKDEIFLFAELAAAFL